MYRCGMLICALLCGLNLFAFNLDDIPLTSERLNRYGPSNVEAHLQSMPLDNIEGIWQFPADGAQVVIERFTPDN